MLNKLERDTMDNLRATCFNLEKDLAHQQKLVRVLAEHIDGCMSIENKIKWAEAKVREEENRG